MIVNPVSFNGIKKMKLNIICIFGKAFAFMPLVVLAMKYNQEADCPQFVSYNGKRRLTVLRSLK